jgi:hypothetical protein
MKPLDLLGKPFGRLVVLHKMRRDDLGWPLQLEPNSFWRCRCDCGAVCVVRGCNLSRGITRSCGCYKRECVDNLNARRWGAHRNTRDTRTPRTKTTLEAAPS